MKKIFVLSFSIILFTYTLQASVGDSTIIRRALIFGIELTGPVISAIDDSNTSYEGYIAYRINHKYYIVGEGGYGSFKYAQYNYTYSSNGMFFRLGTDINLLKPEKKIGNNFVGIGLRYGLSIFNQETPWLKYDNYWGSHESSVPKLLITSHFFQLSAGIRAELFENIFIGWTVRMNMMLHHSAGEEDKPVFIPGMGGTDGTIQAGISFHLAWQIPFN